MPVLTFDHATLVNECLKGLRSFVDSWDFISLKAALDALDGAWAFPERQFDEKFGILQAPALLQRDLAYYRPHC